jgi:hypothetical protein
MERRDLLSAVAPAPAPNPHPRLAARAAFREARADYLAELKASRPKPAPSDTSVGPLVVQSGTDAVKDAWNGYWLVHSKNVAKLGLDFAKVTVSHNTRKVGAAYIKAALKGDGKTLAQLGHTNVVKQVGNDFSDLATSPGVKYVGDQFSKFGKSVADQWNKLFGG